MCDNCAILWGAPCQVMIDQSLERKQLVLGFRQQKLPQNIKLALFLCLTPPLTPPHNDSPSSYGSRAKERFTHSSQTKLRMIFLQVKKFLQSRLRVGELTSCSACQGRNNLYPVSCGLHFPAV